MRIVIGGGGTAGHLVPGIAVAQEFKAQGHTIKYVLRKQDYTYDITDLLSDDEKIPVSLSGFSRKLSLRTVRNILAIIRNWFKVFLIFLRFKPHAMVITGGYVSNIVALSAIIMGVPLYILEQNSAAGITNRFWGRFAKKIFTTFPFPLYVPKSKIIHTGNPSLYNTILPIEEVKDIFELPNNDKKIIGISGGSQGAMFINEIVLKILPTLVEKGYQVVWSLGTREFDRLTRENKLDFLQENKLLRDNVRAYRFISRMDAFWSGSSVVLARSGAGTVTEALFFKTPCIFIPIFNSPDNHQFLNAKFLADANCCCIFEEPTLNAEILKSAIPHIIENSAELSEKFPVYEQDPAKNICNYILARISGVKDFSSIF